MAMKEPGRNRNIYFYHVNDGFHYYLDATTKTKHYFKCVRYEAGCRGRAISGLEAHGFQHTAGHNHGADPYYRQEIALRNLILKSCQKVNVRLFHDIFDDHSEPFPMEVRARVTFASMLNSMRRSVNLQRE